MVDTVYLLRHGYQANWNDVDPPLGEIGKAQAAQFANRFVKNLERAWPGEQIDTIYCPPERRCIETVQPAAELLANEGKLNRGIRIEEGLLRWLPSGIDEDNIQDRMDLSQRYQHIDVGYHDVCGLHLDENRSESITMLYERVRCALDAIIQDLGHHEDSEKEATALEPKVVLLCCSGPILIIACRILTNNIPEQAWDHDFDAFTGCVTKLKRRQAEGLEGSWVMEQSNTGFYLDQELQRLRPFLFERSTNGSKTPMRQMVERLNRNAYNLPGFVYVIMTFCYVGALVIYILLLSRHCFKGSSAPGPDSVWLPYGVNGTPVKYNREKDDMFQKCGPWAATAMTNLVVFSLFLFPAIVRQ